MKNKLLVCMCLLALVNFAFLPVNVLAKTAFFEYTQKPGDTIALWLGSQNLKIQISRGNRGQTMLFQADTSPAALYLLQKNKAIKITEPALRRVAAHLNVRYEQMRKNMKKTLKNLSQAKKKQLRKTMPSFKSINLDTPPQIKFKQKKKTTWHNRAAISGEFWVNSQRRAKAILLSKSPVKLTGAQRKTLRKFQSHLFGWIEIVRHQPAFTGGKNPFKETQNLIGNYYPRLAKFVEPQKTVLLNHWDELERVNLLQGLSDLQIHPIDRVIFKNQ